MKSYLSYLKGPLRIFPVGQNRPGRIALIGMASIPSVSGPLRQSPLLTPILSVGIIHIPLLKEASAQLWSIRTWLLFTRTALFPSRLIILILGITRLRGPKDGSMTSVFPWVAVPRRRTARRLTSSRRELTCRLMARLKVSAE